MADPRKDEKNFKNLKNRKMKKIIPCGHQWIDNKDIKEVVKILKTDWITQGPKIKEFEKALAKYCRAQYAVAVSHGTAALHLAYLTAGLRRGDEIITTPNTFVATTNMLLAIGAKPIFCDIRLDTYNIDEGKIKGLITKKTKAIVPVHFAGHPCEMNKILKIAKKYKLLVIEDACHALGAKYKNKKIGSLNSDMTVFSFHPVKSITTGEGGAIVTNNKKYYKKLVLLRNHGIYKDKQGKNVMIELGYNYRITDIQAALGLSQLKKIDKFIKKRHTIINWYKEELKNIKNINLPTELCGNSSAWHLYVITVMNPKIRYELMNYLKKNNIETNFHYPAAYSHPYYQRIGYKKTELPNMEKYQSSCITFPCHVQLSKKDIKYIADKIKKFFNEKEK